MIKIIKYDNNPITSIGEVAGICWGADTKDKTKNYKIKNGYLYKGLFKKIGKIKFIRIKR